MLAYLTSPGSFLPFDLRPHIMRAFSSVATSIARKGILFAFRIVSNLDVAVMMWEEPAVREVYRNNVGSVVYDVGGFPAMTVELRPASLPAGILM